jgi:hypothetical protein
VYELRLVAAGVVLQGPAPVVVLAQGETVRLSSLPDAAPELALPEGARAEVDVWLARADREEGDASAAPSETSARVATGAGPSRHLGAPVLHASSLVAALRVGRELLVLGDCAGPHLAFADEVDAALVAEQRSLAVRGFTSLDAAERDPRPEPSPSTTPALVQLRRSTSASGSSLHARASRPVELSLLLDADGRPLRAHGGTLELYPATELPPLGHRPRLVARWRLPAGVAATLSRAAHERRAPEVQVELHPSPVASGAALQVRARLPRAEAGSVPALALRFDERSTAFGAGTASHRFTALGPAQVHALVVLPDATAVRRVVQVQVVTEAAVGCAVSGPKGTPRGHTHGAVALGLWSAAWLLKRRPPRARGNTLGARSRSSQRPRTLAPKAQASPVAPEPEPPCSAPTGPPSSPASPASPA